MAGSAQPTNMPLQLLLPLVVMVVLGGCVVVPNPRGAECAQDGTCPERFTCFPDFRCYPYDADPPCNPPCYGAEPFCDKATLRCVECRADDDCETGSSCVPPVLRCRPDCAAGGCMGEGCTSDAACTTLGLQRCDVPSGQCVSCLPGRGDCSPGTVCVESNGSFRCERGCNAAADCPASGPGQVPACCDHRCADVLSSNDDCGACGNRCEGNDSCCEGVCVDLTRSADHCGGCGRSCYLPNVTGVRCTSSQCGNQGCQQYFGNCDGDLQSNGCEENHSFSRLHCGGCGNACAGLAHRPGVCVLLSCTTGPCEEGWGDCDGQWQNGCERPLNTPGDCGGCDLPCAANQTCSSGTCR